MKQNVPFYNTYRSLQAKIYRLRIAFIRLTDTDIFLVFLVASGLWAFIDRTGIAKNEMFFGLRFDPWLWFGGAIITTLGLSLANKFRPDDSIEIVIRGLFAPRFYAPRTRAGDRFWKPVNRKIHFKRK